MAIQLIEKHYSFSGPGTKTEWISVAGTILKGTAVIRGIEPSYPNNEDHNLKRLKMRIANPAVVDGKLTYTLDFFMSDDSGNNGNCNFDVLVVIDVDTDSSLAMTGQSVQFPEPGATQVRVPFYNTIRSFGAAIQGFDMAYADGDDHNVQTLGAQITQVNAVDNDTGIEVTVRFDMNDDSGNLGKGSIDIVVFADIGAKSA
jgi:hypothetical protein